MTGTIESNPTAWSVIGNIAPVGVSEHTTTDVFTVNNCTLTLESKVMVDGHNLTPVKSTPSF